MSKARSSRGSFAVAALAAAALVLGTSTARADVSEAAKNEMVARQWYALWAQRRDWAPFDAMLSDDFAFSSTNGEDHISKAEFKRQCWAPNVNLTKGFDLELVMAKGNEVFVKYLGHTVNGKTFRNVELLRMRHGKIASIECYFGGKMTFPSGVESQKN
ncbi:MAG TPA: nuclear transport factor 2 family protein [Myxococcales bacterium]|nr:nuclear transport factor 2 family protein [Myxococcales bacterium]